jgi:hypothetical protein
MEFKEGTIGTDTITASIVRNGQPAHVSTVWGGLLAHLALP